MATIKPDQDELIEVMRRARNYRGFLSLSQERDIDVGVNALSLDKLASLHLLVRHWHSSAVPASTR